MVRGFIKKRPPTGLTPDFGAIFMSSNLTKKECLRKKLFGLPSGFNSFIKHVKAGMLLFLFEYESRQLHGVFEATSDGAIDIMPDAYTSSGKKFPAQVKVKIVWNCQPLMEHEFSEAIKDNYFQATKFNFGLSKDQVYHLLVLFEQNRVWTEEPCNFATQHAYQEEKTDDLYLESQEPARYRRTGHPISQVGTHYNQDTPFTGREDPIIHSQLISTMGAPITKKKDAVSYYQPYDPDKPYFHCSPTSAGTGVKSFISESGSGFPSRFEGQSEETRMVAENVNSFIDSIRKDLELGDFISMDSPSCTGHCNPTKNSNPDRNQAASLSSRHYGYPEPYCNCRFWTHRVREKVASSSRNDVDGKFIYEATDRVAKVGTRSKRLGIFEQPDKLYFGDHTKTGCKKDFELEDFIPLDFSPCVKPYHPTIPDCHQATSLSSRHFGYPEQSHNCMLSQRRVRENVASSYNIHEEQISSDKGAKEGTRSQKRVSVFSRISFAPKDSRESDYKNGSTLPIMEQLQKKHDNWSNKFYKGHGGSGFRKVPVSQTPKLRLTSRPIQQDAKGVMEAGGIILETNSIQKEKRESSDGKDLQVAKKMTQAETYESNAIITEKVEAGQMNPECSSTQKQNKRRKLIRPDFGFRPLSKECVTFPEPDSQLPREEQEASKRET